MAELKRRKRSNRGVSLIISSLIMAAMVLVIGASVWSFATSASSIISTNYYEEVMESVEKVKERFVIENTGVDADTNTLKIWLYNYGPIDLTIDLIRVTGGNNISYQSVSISVSAGEIKMIAVEPTEISLMRGLSVTIELRSSRGSKTYDSIRVP